MRLIFAGTPDFARVALERLHAARFDIALVLTQPDRPAGRGLKLQSSSVKQWAVDYGIPVAQPRSLRLDGRYGDDAQAARQSIEGAGADAMVVAAYGLILPKWVLEAPRLGCFNIHASLLPRWRGAAPIHRAIEAGDTTTGVTIMQMDAGLDTGDMLLSDMLAIEPHHTTGVLHDALADVGARLMVEALGLAACGGLSPVAQPAGGVTYAEKIHKREAALDWSLPAAVLERRIRAFNPFPGATASLRGDVIKIWSAQVLSDGPASGPAGQIVAALPGGIDVCTSDAVLRLTRLQKAGAKPLDVREFLQGHPIMPGMAFDLPDLTAGLSG